MSVVSAPVDYSLGVDDAENARLIAQCALHRAEAESLLDRLGVRAGQHVLDLGCGPLGVLDLLASRVGPGGRVVGVDRAARYLATAARTVGGRGVGAVELVTADAAATGLPSGAFDVVHERLVLVNVPDPESVVAEMARLTRPGGWVAAQDVDWLSWTCLPAHPDWDVLAAAVGAVWSGDVHIGRRLPHLLSAAGLVDVGVAAHARVHAPGEPNHTLLLRFARIHRDAVLAAGLLSADAFDTAVDRLGRHLAGPGSFTLYATFVQAWGRRP